MFQQQNVYRFLYNGRGFYGTLEVQERLARLDRKSGMILIKQSIDPEPNPTPEDGVTRDFIHGNTVHGIQAFLPGRERMPTTYYTERGGGFAILNHPKYKHGESIRVCLVGLGVGVMACYAREKDYYRAYEISPEVLDVATNTTLFTFVSGAPTKIDIVCDDARKGLEKELKNKVEPYDVIVVDAFSGDTQPYHIFTKEAFELYFKMLKPDGVIAVNISNMYMDLRPFVRSIGDALNCSVFGLVGKQDLRTLCFGSRWAFFFRQPPKNMLIPEGTVRIDFSKARSFPVPTDEKGSFTGLVIFYWEQMKESLLDAFRSVKTKK